ncbi:hypothetical protein [Priestia megaterium]|uniref:hypothetical protein n=1 Tax=Priestia megaterium TaxID=1404 RepID=UPI002877CD0F|nr:hypothetical protein [Priestia megaterium]
MIIGGRRGCGKTKRLIEISSENNTYIVCADQNRLKHIVNMAKKMGLDIPFPITVSELPLRGSFIKEVLVDDAEDVLAAFIGRRVKVASTSMELNSL